MTWRYDPHACAFARARQAQILARKRLITRQRRAQRRAQRAADGDTPDPPRRAPAQSPRQATGAHYENLALDYLLQAGLTLLARNPRCRMGEIDLVMRDGDVIVFVEVRARAAGTYGGALASITSAKQARLIRAAGFLLPGLIRLLKHDLRRPVQPAARFDVVAFDGDAILWLQQAFALD